MTALSDTRISYLKDKLRIMANPRDWRRERAGFGPSDAYDLLSYLELLEKEVASRAAP